MDFYDQQAGLGFLVNQLATIEPQVYKIAYPDIQYPQLVPVDTSGNEWSQAIVFFSSDTVGQAEWFHHYGKDVPYANVDRNAFLQPVEMAAIGYKYTLQEIATAQMLNMNLTTDKAEAARRGYEEFMEDLVLRGSAVKNYSGLIAYPGITAVNAPADGTASSTYWSAKTPALIARDINLVLTGAYVDSKQVEMADTVLLPITEYARLINTQNSVASDISLLEYIQRSNIYTATTGQPLLIRGVRGLETAAAGSTGRMVAYRRDPQVLKVHLPMPHRFMPAAQVPGSLIYKVPGIFRTGGLEIRRPGAVRYLDLISATPA